MHYIHIIKIKLGANFLKTVVRSLQQIFSFMVPSALLVSYRSYGVNTDG